MSREKNVFDGVPEFLETVRSQSFTAAAERLGLTGSAVGKSVTRLEDRLGTKLLHRTTRRLSLTAEGQRYYDRWTSLMDEIEGLEGEIAPGTGGVFGRLVIHLPAAFGRRHVMPLLMKLAGQHAGLDLTVNFTERRADLVAEGIDLAVRIGELDEYADLVARPLGQQRLVISASPEYLSRNGIPSAPSDIKQHSCLAGSRNSGVASWLMKNGSGKTERLVIQPRHEFSDGDALLAATLAGAGITQLPTWLIHEHLVSGALVPVLESYTGAEMPIHALWPSSRYLKPVQRLVIDALIEEASSPTSIYRV